jgi:hypothetical protein
MSRSRPFVAFLASIAGLAFSGTLASVQANDVAPTVVPAALLQDAVVNTDVSAQPRRMSVNPRVGGRRGGQVGRVGRVGQVGRVGRVGRVGVGRYGRVGRIGYYTGRYGRYGRYGYVGRYGRVGRVGFVPVPVPLPGPGVRPVMPVAPACPVCPVQACLIAVYTEQNLTGMVLETRDNQPRLDLNGLQNQISSMIIKGGTWDFFPDLEYRGAPPLRLVPGSYPLLEPQWTKRIGSFMCVR